MMENETCSWIFNQCFILILDYVCMDVFWILILELFHYFLLKQMLLGFKNYAISHVYAISHGYDISHGYAISFGLKSQL